MEPRIQYAKTKDGVSIAFWTLGEGAPVVQLPNAPWSHIQLEWQDSGWRRWHERLAERRKVVCYDGRGTGLSDRDAADYSLDAHVMDLEAVVERLGLQKFGLWAPHCGGMIGIAYAARYPQAVSHLVLWSSWAREPKESQILRAVADQTWGLYRETVAHASFGWSAGEEAHRLAAFMRECTTPETGRAILSALWQCDVTSLLPRVSSPTLVLHRRRTRALGLEGVEIAKGLASGIPDAHLALLEGDSTLPWMGDIEAVFSAIDEFLGEGGETSARALAKEDVHTILFTDIEGSTTLTQRLGDAKAQELLRTHNTIVRGALKAHGGSEVKHTGDGIMASFPSASQALQCAVAIQQAVAAQSDMPFRVRTGLNAGEPVAEERDLFGTAVQLARRICDRAEPGQILASNVVRELAAGKGFLLSDHGDVELRGFEDPVRLYEVRWREGG